MMESAQIAKQMIGFQKTVFDNSFNAMVVIQDQTENIMKNFMGQLPWANDDSKQKMTETVAYIKKSRDDFKKAIDDGYSQFEKMFDQK